MQKVYQSMKNRWLVLFVSAVLATFGMVVIGTAGSASASPAVGAVTTSTSVADGTGACLAPSSATDPVNCNRYADKADVWLSGLKTKLADGTYFLAVLDPGGQLDPNDGSGGLLSTDDATARTFTVSGGIISGSSHLVSADGTKIQIAPFADTFNNGGVYILAVCVAVGLPPAAVAPRDCGYDAFKVNGAGGPPVGGLTAPSAAKTAVPTHDRKVHWDITKTVDGVAPVNGVSSETFNQLTPRTVNYSVVATKTVDYDTYGLTGVITITNSNLESLTVSVTEDGIVPTLTGSSCSLLDDTDTPIVGAATLVVPGKDPITLDDGTASVNYSCSFTTADMVTNYTNTATASFDLDDGNGTQNLPFASDPFKFPTATLAGDSDPESTTVTDAFDGGSAALLTDAFTGPTGVISDSHTFSYQRTIFNSNCHTYPNTATLVANGDTAQASVTFCGPNSGGLTMGWWQNKNGQNLLKNNLTNACTTVNGYLPGSFSHGAASYLPDAYTQNKSFQPLATYQYVSAECGTSGKKSYLPTFDMNVFTAANAAGTGTMMDEGQWLTTAMNTASYPNFTTAGRPTLSGTQGVVIPTALRTPLGLTQCSTISDLLSHAASNYPSYASSKTLTGVTPALITLLNAINNNQAQTC